MLITGGAGFIGSEFVRQAVRIFVNSFDQANSRIQRSAWTLKNLPTQTNVSDNMVGRHCPKVIGTVAKAGPIKNSGVNLNKNQPSKAERSMSPILTVIILTLNRQTKNSAPSTNQYHR